MLPGLGLPKKLMERLFDPRSEFPDTRTLEKPVSGPSPGMIQLNQPDAWKKVWPLVGYQGQLMNRGDFYQLDEYSTDPRMLEVIMKCANCGNFGHLAATCPSPARPPVGQPKNDMNNLELYMKRREEMRAEEITPSWLGNGQRVADPDNEFLDWETHQKIQLERQREREYASYGPPDRVRAMMHKINNPPWKEHLKRRPFMEEHEEKSHTRHAYEK